MFAIAIDGPAGAGKSSIAKAAAQKLGFIYVDTGALYRAVAFYMKDRGIDAQDAEGVMAALPEISVAMEHRADGQHVLLCGRDVSQEIRTAEISMMASTVSAIPQVRDFLFSLQTDMAKKHHVIMDGRDIGTVVLPQAQVKIFLTASAQVRALRRCKDLAAKGEEANFETVLAEVEKRDRQDSGRETAPLKAAEDAVMLDTSDLSFEQVVQAVVNMARTGGAPGDAL